MPSSQGTKRSGSRLTGAIAAGLLLVPATAIAALAIVGSVSRPPAAVAATDLSTTSTTGAPETSLTTSTTVTDDERTDEEAIQDACTLDAQELLEKELDASITEVEAAALDALREICEAHDLPIAGPPVPEPIVQVVSVRGPSSSSIAADDQGDDDATYDDEDDDEDHEDDEDEDEDEEDDDDEDHEDEEDDEDEG
ncbi:MAG: hypothetical protein ABFR89_11665 [Actinomycetota bacterium]